MAISTITGTTTSATTDAAVTQTSIDFTMFLKLLTTQMQNQDPLKPMDSTEYTQQLAQFTQVEQTVKQSGLLSDILARLSTQDMAQASSFIGREAEFDSAIAGLSGEDPARWRIAAPAGTASLTAIVTDSSGNTVATRTLETGATEFSWDGTRTDGTAAAAGAYTLTLAASDASGGTLTAKATSLGAVRDVQSANGVVTLGVNGVQQPLAKLVRLATAAD